MSLFLWIDGYTERQNLSMRMGMRRFTRLTNAFSNQLENQEYAAALYFMSYNFNRIHQTLRVAPSMEAGISWEKIFKNIKKSLKLLFLHIRSEKLF